MQKVEYKTKEMFSEFESRLETVRQAQVRHERETETYLHNLHSELTNLQLKVRSSGLNQAREQLLADIALENTQIKNSLATLNQKVESSEFTLKEYALLVLCMVEAMRISSDLQ